MKTRADPTGQHSNRKRGERALRVRLNSAQSRILALFRAIPKTRRTKTDIQNAAARTVYDYDATSQDLRDISRSITFILNDELLESQNEMPFDWYWKDRIEDPYREGTLEEVVIFNQLIAGAVVAGVLVGGFPPRKIEPQEILLSPQYADNLNKEWINSFNSIKSLSETTSSQVFTQVNLGIQAGDPPTVISKSIQKRFDVSKSSADRIARTEVNKSYNDSKMALGNIASERTGLRAGVLHISALTPTTRKTHADRHGNAYTNDQQLQWWNKGANRINCLCSTRSVLIDRQGKLVDIDLQNEVKAERKFFE
ncbi:MAG: hypothetical protein KAR42_15690 [candidate division Zixibacteria bacterium]|nr:hypothetical protein [candidate division Zixibacteria bacterium]